MTQEILNLQIGSEVCNKSVHWSLPLVDRLVWTLVTLVCLTLSIYWSVSNFNDWQSRITITTLKVGRLVNMRWKLNKYIFFTGRRKASIKAGIPLRDNLLKRFEHGGGEESLVQRLCQLED